MIASALLFAAAAVQGAPADWPHLPRCASATAPIEQPCTLPPTFSPRALAALLGEQRRASWVAGDRLNLVFRPANGEPAMLCCTFQTALEPLAGTPFSAITLRVPRMCEALFDIGLMTGNRGGEAPIIRGPDAPTAPPRTSPLAGRIDEVAIHSAALGDDRYIYVYVPPDIAPGERLPVVYLADGNTSTFAPLAEAAARDGRARRVIIVGMTSGNGAVAECGQRRCERRILEYMPDYNGDGPQGQTWFGRHMAFVADEVIPYIESHYPASPRREDRISAGHSAGGAWAFAAAEYRPDLFGGVLAMSSGSRGAVRDAGRLRGARVYGGGGTFDAEFLDPTRDAVTASVRAGADGRFREIVSGHSIVMWEILFADGLAWLLPAGRAAQ